MESLNEVKQAPSWMTSSRQTATPQPSSRTTRSQVVQTGGDQISWRVGDKAEHKKWGVGTVVSMKGEGESIELDIAFPNPIGVKRLFAKFAPITKQ